MKMTAKKRWCAKLPKVEPSVKSSTFCFASLCAVWQTDIFMPQRIQNIVPLTILSNHERLFLFFSSFFRNVIVCNRIRNLSISNCISYSWSKEWDTKFRWDSDGDKDADTTRFTSYELPVWQCRLTLILRRSRTGTVWFYTSTSNKRAARPKLYTKSLTRDLKLMYSRFTLVRISINL